MKVIPARFSKKVQGVLASTCQILRVRSHTDDGDRQLLDFETFSSVLGAPEETGIPKKYVVAKNYYDMCRDEIIREDEITFKRLNIMLIFQGFLFTALALSSGRAQQCFNSTEAGVVCQTDGFFVGLALLLCFSGFSVAFFGFHGIDASRRSVMFARNQWVMFNRINGNFYPNVFPQLFKRSNRLTWEKPGKRLDRHELLNLESFTDYSHAKEYRDEGWDFALSMPIFLMLAWGLMALVVMAFL